jgi:hypothetical protein
MTVRSNSDASPLLDDAIIRAPRLLPYLERPCCPACGHVEVSRLTSLLRILWGRETYKSFGRRHCAGGKAPTEDHPHPLGKMLGESIVNECADVYEPHLHVNCACCGYKWLSKTKEKV